MRKLMLGCGTGLLLAALAATDGRAGFGKTLAYTLCTLMVMSVATLVTIRGAVRLGQGRPGWGDRPGYVEAGFLIGVFAVAPTALAGAFTILNALIGLP